MNASFSAPDKTSINTRNYIIDEEIEYWKKYGSGIYPSIVINNRTYRGQLESLAVFNALCAGFEDAPSMCSATLSSYKPDFLDQGDGINAGMIIAIVLILIVVNMLIVYCYRRSAKREMQQNMNV